MRKNLLVIIILVPFITQAMNEQAGPSNMKRSQSLTTSLGSRRLSTSSTGSTGSDGVMVEIGSEASTPPSETSLSKWASVEVVNKAAALDKIPESPMNRSGSSVTPMQHRTPGDESDNSGHDPYFTAPIGATPSETDSSTEAEDLARQQLLARATAHLKENPSAIRRYKTKIVVYSASKAAGTTLVLGCAAQKLFTSELWESLIIPKLPDNVVDAIDQIQDPKIFLGALSIAALATMGIRALSSLITINSTPPTSPKIEAILDGYTLTDETKAHLTNFVTECVHNMTVVTEENNALIQKEIGALEAQKGTLAQQVTAMKAYRTQLNQQNAAVDAAQRQQLIAHSAAVQKTSQEIKERLDTLTALHLKKAAQQNVAATKPFLFGRKS